MPNVLDFDKQCTAIAALAEGTSIRAVERMTGVHRDTIMRLGVRVGQACAEMMDKAMFDLPCRDIQVDELWGFIGKKQRRVANESKTPHYQGDVWTYVAIDRETKLIPSFVCGKRDMEHTQMFLDDLGSRVGGRIQLSSDALQFYRIAAETAFVQGVDHGAIVKTYTTPSPQMQRRYSPAKMVRVTRVEWTGRPDLKRTCTSHVEAQNLTVRMHVRRLTRLTNAFSKRIENFRAAIAMHFAYVNFVKVHTTIKTTPAVAAGISSRLWTVRDLVGLQTPEWTTSES